MTDFLVLLKISSGKIVDTMDALRKVPRSPLDGVDLAYTMNIFGTWDVGLWFNAENTAQAIDFVHKRIKKIPGVVDVYTLPTFPHRGELPRESNNPEEPKKTEIKTVTKTP